MFGWPSVARVGRHIGLSVVGLVGWGPYHQRALAGIIVHRVVAGYAVALDKIAFSVRRMDLVSEAQSWTVVLAVRKILVALPTLAHSWGPLEERLIAYFEIADSIVVQIVGFYNQVVADYFAAVVVAVVVAAVVAALNHFGTGSWPIVRMFAELSSVSEIGLDTLIR